MVGSAAIIPGVMAAHFSVVEEIEEAPDRELYLAEDVDLKRRVRLCFLPAKQAADSETRARFLTNVRALAALNHPNITRVYEWGEYEGRPFAALEHNETEPLNSILKNGRVSIGEALEMVIPIVRGLAEAHRSGLVYHWLWPGNVGLAAGDMVKLFAEGFLGEGAGPDPLAAGYVSVEQAQGKEIDGRSNVFSLGLIFYELLTGERPFVRDDVETTLAAVINDPVPPSAESQIEISQGLKVLVDRTLEKRPESRYQSADELLKDLEAERGRLLQEHSENRYSTLMDQTADAFYIHDLDGRFIDVNKRACEMLGYTREELLQMSVPDIDSDAQALGDKKHLWNNLPGREPLTFIRAHRRKDGSTFPVEICQGPIEMEGRTFALVQVRDITERMKKDKELRESNERLNATLDALPDILFEVDRHGRILEFRARHTELLYRSPSRFLGKTVHQVLPERASDVIMHSIEKALKVGRCSGAVYSLDMGDNEFWFELSVVARGDLKARDIRLVGLVRDVTDRKRNEDLLRQMTADLKAEQEALMERNVALKQVLEHLENQREDYRQEISRDLRAVLDPFFKKIRGQLGDSMARELNDLEQTIDALVSTDSEDFRNRYAGLTSRESELCEMIRNGMSSREISEVLKLSLRTVLKHREIIRKKLGIANRSISLEAYLRSR